MNLSGFLSLQTVWVQSSGQTAITIIAAQPINDFNASGNALSSANVEAILIALDANGQINGTVDLSGQTPPAPPASAAAWAAWKNLKTKGWTVTIDAPVDWQPPTELVSWTDSGGAHAGSNLAAFLAAADFGTISIFSQTTSGGGLTSIDGLYNLPALVNLNINDVGIASLTLNNPGLTDLTLYISNGPWFGPMDLTTCPNLVNATVVSSVGFTDLIVTGLTSLQSLICSSSGITSITGIGDCTSLTSLTCDNNALTALNLTGLSSVQTLDCSSQNGNPFVLTLTGCSGLTSINSSNCPWLTAFNGSDCINLQILTLNSCALTSLLGLTAMPSLLILDCQTNQLTGLLDLTGNPSLQACLCWDNFLDDIDVSASISLTDLEANNNQLTSTVVDTILYYLDGIGNLNGVLTLNAQLPSPPSALGIAYMNSLVGMKSWTVQVDLGTVSPVFADGSGGYWELVVDTSGNLGTNAVAGPATPGNVVLDDGTPAYWKLGVDALGNYFTTPDAGPATVILFLRDSTVLEWLVSVDTLGNLSTDFLVTWTPENNTLFWTDGGGPNSGDLVYFRANADLNTLTNISGNMVGLDNVRGLQKIPFATTLDFSGNLLNVFNVNSILFDIDANANLNTLLNGDINVSGQVPPAPPSVGPPDGIAAVTDLVGVWNWAVSTD